MVNKVSLKFALKETFMFLLSVIIKGLFKTWHDFIGSQAFTVGKNQSQRLV